MSSEWDQALNEAVEKVRRFELFKTEFWDQKKFIKHVNNFRNHLEYYQSLWFSGHFDNAFADIVDEHLDEVRANLINFRVLSLPFTKDSRGKGNKTALEKLSRLKVQVRVNPHFHARMMILFSEHSIASEAILGSFDFNRDGLSRFKINCGIWSRHMDVVESAKKFYQNV